MLSAAFLATLLAPVQGWVVASKFDVRSKLPLTSALRAATDEKLGKQVSCTHVPLRRPLPDRHPPTLPPPRSQLERYDKYLNSVTVSLKVEKHALHDTEHKGKEAHIAEVTALCSDKQVIRVSHECEDMYASLDLLADQLARKLQQHKEKLSQRKQDNLATADVFVAEEPEPDGVDAE
jgi:ribosomal subunit interface protein